jgi:hypothetical protein
LYKDIKNILIIEPGFQIYKEPIIKEAVKMAGCRLYFASGLADTVPFEWTNKYGKGKFEFSYKKNNLMQKCKLFMRQNDIRFDGAFTLVETSVHFVNQLQHCLGLPKISTILGKHVRSKRIMRELFKSHGVAQPKFSVIRNKNKIKSAVAAIHCKFPLIVKPAEMMSSLGVIKVNSILEIMAAYSKVRYADFWDENLRKHYGDISSEILLEQYIDGAEYSVETMVQHGKIRIFGITQKKTTHGTNFDEIGHTYPAHLNSALYLKVERLVERTHRALKLENTITHTEFRINNGVPYLIEVNCRAAGDLITTLVGHSSKNSIGDLLARVHSGVACDIAKNDKIATSVFFFTTNKNGQVISIPKLKSKNKFCIEMVNHVKAGSIIFNNDLVSVSRMGHIVYQGKINNKVIKSIQAKYVLQPFIAEYKLKYEDDYIAIVQANKSQLRAIFDIERKSWTASQQASYETLSTRLATNTDSIIIAMSIKTGRYLGFIHSVPLKSYMTSDKNPWIFYEQLSKNKKYFTKKFRPKCQYIVSISVLPDAPRGTGTILLKGLCKWAAERGIPKVAYGARVTGYGKVKSKMHFSDYYKQIVRNRVYDNLHKAAKNAGGMMCGYIENYFDDPQSNNFGITVVHNTELTNE